MQQRHRAGERTGAPAAGRRPPARLRRTAHARRLPGAPVSPGTSANPHVHLLSLYSLEENLFCVDLQRDHALWLLALFWKFWFLVVNIGAPAELQGPRSRQLGASPCLCYRSAAPLRMQHRRPAWLQSPAPDCCFTGLLRHSWQPHLEAPYQADALFVQRWQASQGQQLAQHPVERCAVNTMPEHQARCGRGSEARVAHLKPATAVSTAPRTSPFADFMTH